MGLGRSSDRFKSTNSTRDKPGQDAYDESMNSVFISYYPKARKQAELVKWELEKLGVPAWLPPRPVSGEAVFEEKMLDEMKNARLVVFLVGPQATASQWVQREYRAALEQFWLDQNKIFLPVLIGNADSPAFLRHVRSIKVDGRRTDWPKVAKEIDKIVTEGSPAKNTRAAIKEQTDRLNLIEKQAYALRASEVPKIL